MAVSSPPLRNAVHCSLPSASPARPAPPKAPRGSIAFQAARLLGPPATFQASKLKVVFLGKEGKQRRQQPQMQPQPLCSLPRTYALTHCDLTANLTLAVSDDFTIDQWRKWQNKIQKDDVVAEWKRVKEELALHVHCYVGGANFFQELAAEFRYYIFCKELPLVLKAVLHGDSPFFLEHPELLDASVWVYFHSTSGKFNRLECWGPLKEAIQRTLEDQLDGLKDSSMDIKLDWRSSETILNALVTIFL